MNETHRLPELDLGLSERRRARDGLALAHGVLWVVHDERALDRLGLVGGNDVVQDRGGAERGGELEGGGVRHGFECGRAGRGSSGTSVWSRREERRAQEQPSEARAKSETR